MQIIHIEGYGFSKRLCKDVVTWFVSKYLTRHKLEIEILHRGLKREHTLGYCDVIGEIYRPRSFLIELDTYMDKKDYVITLLHELCHVKQFVLGELKIKSCKRYYKGECVEDLEYLEQPHEIQAHLHEDILYQEYLKDKGLTDL